MLYYKPSELNVSGSFNKGWNFRTVLKGESGGETIFFPASGTIFGSGKLFYVSKEGYYFSSTPLYGPFILYLYLESEKVHTMSNNSRSYGFSVRPVAEN